MRTTRKTTLVSCKRCRTEGRGDEACRTWDGKRCGPCAACAQADANLTPAQREAARVARQAALSPEALARAKAAAAATAQWDGDAEVNAEVRS